MANQSPKEIWDHQEEIIELEHDRNLSTGEYNVEILMNMEEQKEEVELDYDIAYISLPSEGKWGYLFKVQPHGLYYFKIPRELINGDDISLYQKVEFHIELGEEKKIQKIVGKMLNRALVTTDKASSLYSKLIGKIVNQGQF